MNIKRMFNNNDGDEDDNSSVIRENRPGPGDDDGQINTNAERPNQQNQIMSQAQLAK